MADTIDAIIKIRRGPDGQRRTILLEPGEIAFSTDIGRTFIGDGVKTGGNYVGNHNSFGVAPSPYAIVKDLYYNTTSSIMYLLTSESGPDNMGNYARVSPISDTSTIRYDNGVFSINKSYFDSTSTGYLKLTGGLMYGYITLHQNPISAYHPVTKGYADTLVRTASTILQESLDNDFVHLIGDRMFGYLTLNAHPLSTYHAATKGYTDISVRNVSAFLANAFANKYVNLSGDVLTGYLNLHANPTANLHPATKGYTDTAIRNLSTGFANSLVNKYVNLSGDVLTGYLTLHAHPIANMHPTTKGYTEALVRSVSSALGDNMTNFVKLSGDTLTGFLTLHSNPIDNMHPTTKGYTDAAVAAAAAGLGNNAAATFVKLAGDTMTGSLLLNANPTSNLQAAPKQYIDTGINSLSSSVATQYIKLSGGTISGSITVNNDLIVNQKTSLKNEVDFNNNIIKKFSPVVNTIAVATTYDLTSNDNGSILIINGTGTSVNVYIPDGLPAGFNIMIVQNTNTTVYIRSRPGSSTVIRNIDGFFAIRGQYGVANVVRTSSSPDNYILAGDLVG